MIKHSKLTSYKIKKILRLFCADIPAIKAAEILDFNRKTVDRYYNIFREKIADVSDTEMRSFGDPSGFNQVCVDTKSFYKRSKKKTQKAPIFGIIKKEGKIFVSLVQDCDEGVFSSELEIINKSVYAPMQKNIEYNGFLLNTYDHYRVYATYQHQESSKNHLSGIETFWSFAKRRLTKFNGVAPHKFKLYLKECEFRFNYRKDNLFEKMLHVINKF